MGPFYQVSPEIFYVKKFRGENLIRKFHVQAKIWIKKNQVKTFFLVYKFVLVQKIVGPKEFEVRKNSVRKKLWEKYFWSTKLKVKGYMGKSMSQLSSTWIIVKTQP